MEIVGFEQYPPRDPEQQEQECPEVVQENAVLTEETMEEPVWEPQAEELTEAPVEAPVEAPAEESVEAPVEEEPAPVRRSPFYDSPYEMNRPEPEEPRKVRRTPKRNKKSGSRRILAAVAALALVAGSCGLTAALVNSRWQKQTAQMTQTFNQKIDSLQQQIAASSHTAEGNSVSGSPVAGDGLTPSQVYARNQHSVVLIHSEVTQYMNGQPIAGTSSGSGFILTENGYVVTNHHVVEGAGAIRVTVSDGTEYTATLVGSDENNDVAMLKIEAEGLQPVTLGSSDRLIVGDQVVAIGNPLGDLTSTLTVGYISAKERDVTTDGAAINMLQTDAAINSGNSGGPLFNMKGEVVGIITAKYSGTSSSGASIEGIGFAIPIDDVAKMLTDLMDYGYVTGAYLGVSVYDVDAVTASMYNFPLGCLVDSVVAGSCAERAGVRPSDIIIDLGGYRVEGYTDLARALRKFEAGDETTITVWRSGQELTFNITLDEKPHNETVEPDPSQMPSEGDFEEWYNYIAPFFGQGGN